MTAEITGISVIPVTFWPPRYGIILKSRKWNLTYPIGVNME